MRHGDEEEDGDSMPGQDSFIDVVCNMVGILIVLVMIVGVRASRPAATPSAAENAVAGGTAPTPDPADQKTVDELTEAASRVREAERDIVGAVEKIADLSVQSAVTDARRQELSLVQAIVEKEIEERRAKLDDQGQRQFDVQRAIAEAEIKLHQLTQEQIGLLAEAPEVEEIECVPTPLAKTVTGEEIHVRLKRSLLAVVPADELMAEVQRRGGDHLRSGLRSRNEAEDVFGPIDGFRMRLSVARYATSLPGGSAMQAPQSTIVLQGVFLPISADIGQALEQSLLPGSAFMRAIRAKRTAAPSVTVWVYPDSYGELRTLKRAMWEAGVPLAIRPLPDGQPIIFSTLGSKSSAQ